MADSLNPPGERELTHISRDIFNAVAPAVQRARKINRTLHTQAARTHPYRSKKVTVYCFVYAVGVTDHE